MAARFTGVTHDGLTLHPGVRWVKCVHSTKTLTIKAGEGPSRDQHFLMERPFFSYQVMPWKRNPQILFHTLKGMNDGSAAHVTNDRIFRAMRMDFLETGNVVRRKLP